MRSLGVALALAVGVVCSADAFAKGGASATQCVKGNVLVALETHMLQTELMVGALSCDLTPRYNAFVTTYHPDLMGAHKALLKFFGRESKMEDFKSKLANEASQRSLANMAEFCTATAALYDKLLGTDKPKLAEFVAGEPAASRHGYQPCDSAPVASMAGKQIAAHVPMPRMKPAAPSPASQAAP